MMQFLLISKSDTLQSISRIIGAQNIDVLLAENGLRREPKIGKQWNEKCDNLLKTQPNEISAARKSTLLNLLTDSQEVFEKACLLDEDGWKIFSAFQAFRDALRIPESVRLPYSSRIIGAAAQDVATGSIGVSGYGGNRYRTASLSNNPQSEPISSATYRTVMSELKSSGEIKPEVFNKVNTSLPVSLDNARGSKIANKTPQYSFPLPWGKIQIVSSLLNEVLDIPAYPEQIDTSRSASYTAMPNLIYQYEPWIMYESSGPREQQLVFHLHRDMWSGNHLDGKANKLIKFCEANTFPRYNGSAVQAPTVRIYVSGSLFIAGVMTRTDVSWKGPIGLDDWYLEFELTLSIQEVSDTRLNIDSVSRKNIIGG